MDMRTEFMTRVLRGERVTDLCREYGISRKTGDKFKQRYKRMGMAGLKDLSRAPSVIPHRTSEELVELIVAERNRHSSWGAKKVKDVLERRLNRTLPAASTIHDILFRNGLVVPRKRRAAHKAMPTFLREAKAANDVWCIDYKGQFRLGDRTYCYPLTITDQHSRFILACDGMGRICDEAATEVCQEVFRNYGLPHAMRSDNGVPFASVGLAGLTKLSVYWLRLGVRAERIRPAHPEENGRHERMHRTLKFETARPPRHNLLQQQERFDAFVDEFNHERPHEALAMKRPADVYERSARPLPRTLAEPDYPQHDDVLRVTKEGTIRFAHRDLHLCAALAGQHVGIREELDGHWTVTFMDLDLGYINKDRRIIPLKTLSSPPETQP